MRFHFNSRSRRHDEMVASFVAALRELALHCEYGDYLNDMLRDRLVHDINHKGIQRKLLSEPSDITFDHAFSLVQALEATERDSKTLNETPSQSLQVHNTQSDKSQSRRLTLAKLGLSLVHHPPKKPESQQLHAIAVEVHTSPRSVDTSTLCADLAGSVDTCNSCCRAQDTLRVPSKNNYVTKEKLENSDIAPSLNSSEDISEDYELFTLSTESKCSKRYSVNLLNGVAVEMELDMINQVTYNRLKDLPSCRPLRPTEQSLKSYSGHEIQLLGVMDTMVKLSPLYLLLNKHQRWSWGTEQQQAFEAAKEALEADTLVHYDPSKPLVIACDASQYGIGVVLSHVQDDGSDRPVAYMSRTLSAAERNYSVGT